MRWVRGFRDGGGALVRREIDDVGGFWGFLFFSEGVFGGFNDLHKLEFWLGFLTYGTFLLDGYEVMICYMTPAQYLPSLRLGFVFVYQTTTSIKSHISHPHRIQEEKEESPDHTAPHINISHNKSHTITRN